MSKVNSQVKIGPNMFPINYFPTLLWHCCPQSWIMDICSIDLALGDDMCPIGRYLFRYSSASGVILSHVGERKGGSRDILPPFLLPFLVGICNIYGVHATGETGGRNLRLSARIVSVFLSRRRRLKRRSSLLFSSPHSAHFHCPRRMDGRTDGRPE